MKVTPKKFGNDFLIKAALMALERWDRLAEGEQQRFRELARSARGDAAGNLEPSDRNELRAIWKKLEARKLLREVAGELARGRRGTGPGP